MNARILGGLLVAAAAGVAHGQVGSGGTLTVGNARFTLGNFTTTANGAVTGITSANTADLFLNQGATPNLDNLFGSSWWYRVDGVDTRELVFNNALPGSVWAGNTGTVNFSYAGKFDTQLQYVLSNAPAGGATVVQTARLTNTTAAPIVISLFNYLDTFVRGADAGDALTAVSAPTDFSITDAPYTVTYSSPGATAYQAQAWSGTFQLVNAGIENLNNTGAPFVGDANLAVQWQSVTLAPGQPITFTSTITLIPAPASAVLMGLGGLIAVRRRRA